MTCPGAATRFISTRKADWRWAKRFAAAMIELIKVDK